MDKNINTHKGPLTNSWYAIRLNDSYWLGSKIADPTGNMVIVSPSTAAAILIPTDSDTDEVDRFRQLAKIHGGQLVQLDLNMTACIDEMLKVRFDNTKRSEEDDQTFDRPFVI